MKVKFSRSHSYIPDWNGNKELPEADQIKTTISPMEIGELITIMDAFGMQSGTDDKIAINMKNYNSAIKELNAVIPKYIKIENFNDEDGNPIGIETILTYGQFMTLSVELLMKCVEYSVPSETVEKN